MKVGISTASLFLKETNESAVKLLNEWNIDCAEVFLTSFSEYELAFAEELKARKGNLDVYSVHDLNTQFEPQLYAAHPRVKADAFGWLAKVMQAAQILGAKYYTFHGIARIKRTFQENLFSAAERTWEIYEFCERYGVQLSYENVEWALVNRPEVFPVLKERCPHLGAVLDIKQARISGYDYRDYLKAMGSSITHVHVSDIAADGRMCLPGKGTFDFDELFSRLCDFGFTGAVLIENYAKDFDKTEELKESYLFLKEKIAKYA